MTDLFLNIAVIMIGLGGIAFLGSAIGVFISILSNVQEAVVFSFRIFLSSMIVLIVGYIVGHMWV
jgi:hypothetical protein